MAEDDSLFSFYANVYLPTIVGRSQNWKNQVAWAMDRYILPRFGQTPIDQLNRTDAQRFFNGLRRKLADSSIGKIKIVFSGVLNLAEDDEVITRNAVRRVRVNTPQTPDKTALTLWQLKNLYLATEGLRSRPVVIFGGFCSLRVGEICAPNRGEIRGGILYVRHQIQYEKGKGFYRTPKLKTPQSRRDIPLPSPLQDALLNAGQVSSIWITSDSVGGWLTPKNATRELTEACRIAGMGEWVEKPKKNGHGMKLVFVPMVTPHDLRHTFISLLENELEAPDAIVACLAGRKHKGLNAGYSHTFRHQLERWMVRLWNAVMEATEDQTSTLVRQHSVVQEA